MDVNYVDWKDRLRQAGICKDDFPSIPAMLVDIFRGIATPDVFLTSDGKVEVTENCIIKIGGGSKIHNLLNNTHLFLALPDEIKENISDILYLLLRSGTYDVARFRCSRERIYDKNIGLVKILLNILHETIALENISISKLIIRLLGVTCAAGINTSDLKEIVQLLRKPSELTISLLQTLKIMIKQDDGVVKASPTSFFNFNGYKSGLYINNTTFPFTREYQIALWFRVETFVVKYPPPTMSTTIQSNLQRQQRLQHIFTCLNITGHGIDIYIENKYLNLTISDSRNESTHIKVDDFQLRRAVWYHLSIRHSKPRLSIFSRDELSIHIDGEQLYQGNVRFPNGSYLGDITDFSWGKHFDGQMGPMYIFSEALPTSAIELIARLNAGKVSEGQSANEGVDLMQSVALTDRKMVPFTPKLIAAYHPSRCLQRAALDVHGGRAARLGKNTYPWTIVNARDTLQSLGGMSCLLPAFPHLLIEYDYFSKQNSDTAAVEPNVRNSIKISPHDLGRGLGIGLVRGKGSLPGAISESTSSVASQLSPRYDSSSILPIETQPAIKRSNSLSRLSRYPTGGSSDSWRSNSMSFRSNDIRMNSMLSNDSFRLLSYEASPDLAEEGIVGLLLSLIARCIRSHRTNQNEMLRVSGIQMIEYALTCTPQEVLYHEGESCVLALIQLRSATKDSIKLETLVTKNLLCNFKIWSRASFQLQSSLMSVVLAAVKAQTEYFISTIGVPLILDCISSYYVNTDVIEVSNGLVSEHKPRTESTSSIVKATSLELTPVTDSIQIRRSASSEESSKSAASEASMPSIIPTENDSKQTEKPKKRSTVPVLWTVGELDKAISSPNSPQKRTSRKSNFMAIIRQASVNFIMDDSDDISDGLDISKHNRPLMKSIGLAASSGTDFGAVGEDDKERGQNDVDSEDVDVDKIDTDGDFVGPSENSLSTTEESPGNVDKRDTDVSDAETIDHVTPVSPKSPENVMVDESDFENKLKLDSDPDVHTTTMTSCLNAEEKMHIRSSLEMILLVMIQFGPSSRDIESLVDFLASCTDDIVSYEIAQLFMSIFTECGNKVAILITDCCHGLEEFAAFILCYLVNRSHESLRCAGIRLLTHYYMHTETLPTYSLNLSLKRKKGGVLARVRDRLAGMTLRGMERLGACGGLALLSVLLKRHKESSTEATYITLLEMLLATPSTINQASTQYRTLSEDTTSAGGPVGLSAGSSQPGGSSGPVHGGMLRTTYRVPITASSSLNAQQITDETAGITSPVVLSVFLDILPTLPIGVLKRVYFDLLALLKHSASNRDAFCAHARWHVCLNDLVTQIIVVNNTACKALRPVDFNKALDRYLTLHPDSVPIIKSHVQAQGLDKSGTSQSCLLRDWGHNTQASQSTLTSISLPVNLSGDGDKDDKRNSNSQRDTMKALSSDDAQAMDLWFDIGMKIYATVLLHAMDLKGGWKELEKAFIHCKVSLQRTSISRAVFSHVFHELTFTMQSKYKDLLRQAKSVNPDDTSEASIKLENLLMLLVTGSHFLLEDIDSVAVLGVPNMQLGRMRLQIISDILRERMDSGGCCRSTCTAETHNICEDCDDLCFSCGHSASLHDPNPNPDMRDTIEERLVILLQVQKLQEKSNTQQSKPYSPHAFSSRNLPGFVSQANNDSSEAEILNDPLGSHVWTEIIPETFNSFRMMLISEDTTGLSPEFVPLRRTESNNFTSDNLDPLSRCVEGRKSHIVLVLQALRCFDLIFWPKDTLEMRNQHLMRFQRSNLTSLDNSGNKGQARSRSGSWVGLGPSMSLAHGVMRMCLFIASTVAPTEEVAELNLRRIHQIILMQDKFLSGYISHMNDWLVCTVLHIFLVLTRIRSAFLPLINLIKRHMDTDIQSGYETDDGSVATSPNDFESHVSSSVSSDSTSYTATKDSPQIELHVEYIFDNVIGKRILKYIHSALRILETAFSMHKELIGVAFGGNSQCSMGCFLSRRKNAVDTCAMARTRTRASTVSSNPPNPSVGMSQRPHSPAQDSMVHMLRDLAQSEDDSHHQNQHQQQQQQGLAGCPSSPNTVGLSHPSTLLRDFSRGRGDSGATDDVEKSSDTSRKPTLTLLEIAQSYEETLHFGKHVVSTLQSLCDPFFLFDPMQSENIVSSLLSLEKFEKECVFEFVQTSVSTTDNTDDSKGTDAKLAHEVIELQELGKSVHKMFSVRDLERRAAHESTEVSKISVVASSWQHCLRLYDSDWSPWITDESEQRLLSQLKLSAHRDRCMRRMLLTKMAEATDHSDKAYNRSREDYCIGGTDTSSVLSNIHNSIASGFLRDAMKLIRPKPSVTSESEEMDAWTVDDGASSDIQDKALSLFSGTTEKKRPTWTLAFQWSPDEKEVVRMNALRIDMEKEVFGCVLMTNKYLYYHPKRWTGGLSGKDALLTDRRWRLDRLVETYGRRHLLQNSAIELFFADNYEVFFAFDSSAELNRFFHHIVRQNTPLLITPNSLNPRYVFSHSEWTELWRRRVISNFEYLMRLNIIAGRSYNDITQYPVFPWVLADYTSESLDLSDPNVFRDLTKPIGALNADRLADLMERYRTFEDPEVPKFMFGSHYSSAGVVLHYMLRIEPFTTLAVNLQGGRFDVADRLFFDVKSTWDGCNNSISDVKELIPELFCCPEALINFANLPLGELQDNQGTVGDVVVPPWAGGDPYEFVRLNREALESEYVSSNLHHWIDLIFGYKQTGKAAIEACNVFYYLTYENAIDIETIEDPLQREAAKQQVLHFGQTPSQLTTKKHPQRLPKEECMSSLCSDIGELGKLRVFIPSKQFGGNGSELGPVTAIGCSNDRVVVYHSDQTICHYRWSAFPDAEAPFQLRMERSKQLPSMALCMSKESMSRRGFSTTFNIPVNEDTPINSPRTLSFRALSADLGKPTADDAKTKDRESSLPPPPVPQPTPAEPAKKILFNILGAIKRTVTSATSGRNSNCSQLTQTKSEGSMQKRTERSTGVHHERGSHNIDDDDDDHVDGDDNETDWKYFNESDDDDDDDDGISETQSIADDGNKNSPFGDYADLTPITKLEEDEDFDDEKEETSTEPMSQVGLDSDEPLSPSGFGLRDLMPNLELNSDKYHDTLSIGTGSVSLSLGDSSQGRIISCGYWDQTVKVHALDSMKELSSVTGGHIGQITCLQLGADNHTFVTGGYDGTCRVWVLEDLSIASAISEEANIPLQEDIDSTLICVHVLCGHDSPVSCLSYSHDHDLLLSGSKSGMLCLHTIRKGRCIRTVTDLKGKSIDVILLTAAGYFVVHSWSDLSLHLFWLNGQHRTSVVVTHRIECLAVNGTGNVLVCGGSDGMISLRTLWDLHERSTVDIREHGRISCLRFTDDYQFLMVGSADGTLSICTDPEVRWRMLKLALQKTPMLGQTMS